MFFDKKTKRQIINDIILAQLESVDGLNQLVIPIFNNTVEVPLSLDDNIWILTVDINGYEPISIKFITMLGWISLDSCRKVFIGTLSLPLCKTPINKSEIAEIWQGIVLLMLLSLVMIYY